LEEKGRQVQKLLWGKKGRIYKTAEVGEVANRAVGKSVAERMVW
jgi:hypothetical protein